MLTDSVWISLFVNKCEKKAVLRVFIHVKIFSAKITPFGASMDLAAIISLVLSFDGYNLRVLMWVDMRGEMMGWVVPAAFLRTAPCSISFSASSLHRLKKHNRRSSACSKNAVTPRKVQRFCLYGFFQTDFFSRRQCRNLSH